MDRLLSERLPPPEILVHRLVETVPQGDWPAGYRRNVDALLTKHHSTDGAANEADAYRSDDIRLHRCSLLSDQVTHEASNQKVERESPQRSDGPSATGVPK